MYRINKPKLIPYQIPNLLYKGTQKIYPEAKIHVQKPSLHLKLYLKHFQRHKVSDKITQL